MIYIFSVIWDAEYDRHEAFPQTEQVVIIKFSGDGDESLPSHGDGDWHVFGSHNGQEVPIETEEESGQAPEE